MTLKKIIQYLTISALALVLLYISFKGVKWSDFIEGIKSCNFYWIIVSMAVGVLGFFARALRWRLLLKPLDDSITLKESYNGVAIGYLTNFAFPRAGEIARCVAVIKKGRISFEQALGTVVVERGIDLLCLLFWALFTMSLKWGESGGFIREELLAPLARKFASALPTALSLLSILLIVVLLCYCYRARLREIKSAARIGRIIKRVLEGTATVMKMRDKWRFLLYTLLIWGTYWCTSYTTICAFPSVANLNGADALFLMILGGLGWAVPVQGGIGAYHFIVSLALLKVYEIPRTEGVVFATISHESQALAMLICGTVALICLWRRKRVGENPVFTKKLHVN